MHLPESILIIVALSLSGSSTEGRPATDGDSPDLPYLGERKLKPTEEAELVTFLERTLKTDLESLRVVKESNATKRDPHGTVLVCINEESPLDRHHIKIDRQDGNVITYSWSILWTALPDHEDKRREDAISAEEAFTVALSYLRYHGLPGAPEEYDVFFDQAGGDSAAATKDLGGHSWVIHRDFTHKGVLCRGRRMVVRVCPYYARVQMLYYRPVVIPEVPVRRIAREDAVASARAWLDTHQYFEGKEPHLTEADVGDILEVIALPNAWFNLESGSEPIEGQVRSFHCWEVPFHFTEYGGTISEHVFRARVWVNIETGEVIGGG